MSFFGIGKIKFRVSKVRVTKVRAGRVLPKPRAGKSASGKINGFSLTVFSSSSAPKGIKRVDVIRALLETNGNRRASGRKLGITHEAVSRYAKDIRRLTDNDLQKYADELGAVVAEIKRVCANFDSRKGTEYIDVIRELLASGGNRKVSAENLGINTGNVSRHAKKIRQLPDADLQKYATLLNTTVDEIKRVCADFNPAKGIAQKEIMFALISANGNRTVAALKLRIDNSIVSEYTKKMRQIPDADLQKYANEWGTTAEEIRRVCADFDVKKGITHIDIIRELLASDGSRRSAAQELGITHNGVSRHAKNIMRLSDDQLQKYADKLTAALGRKITINDIRGVAAQRSIGRVNFERRIQVMRELFAADGSRRIAAKKLGIKSSAVSQHAENIRQLPDAELQKYANKLNITVDEIKRVCADFGAKKGLIYIEVMRELLASGGYRKDAARRLRVADSAVHHHAKSIMRLPEAELAQYAVELGVSVERIKQVCAPRLEQAKKL